MGASENIFSFGFFPTLLKGYLFGTVLAACALHIAVSIIAPGDAGTLAALGNGSILFVLLLVIGFVGAIAFPVAAIMSWPLRSFVNNRPLQSLTLAAAVGVGLGSILTAMKLQIGPDDFYSGPIVGLVYAISWFVVVRSEGPYDD